MMTCRGHSFPHNSFLDIRPALTGEAFSLYFRKPVSPEDYAFRAVFFSLPGLGNVASYRSQAAGTIIYVTRLEAQERP